MQRVLSTSSWKQNQFCKALKITKNSSYTSLQGGWLLWCCRRKFFQCALPSTSTLVNTLSPLRPWDYFLTGCHDCICYIWLRRCFSFPIHCTSLVDFVSYCTSPFSLIYSFLTLSGCHFLGASPLWLWTSGCFWRFADVAPQLFIHYSLSHVCSSFFTVRHLLWMMFCCSTALIAYTILGYVTENNIIPVRHLTWRCILLYVMLKKYIHLRHWLLAIVVIASLYNLLLYGAYLTYNISVRHLLK